MTRFLERFESAESFEHRSKPEVRLWCDIIYRAIEDWDDLEKLYNYGMHQELLSFFYWEGSEAHCTLNYICHLIDRPDLIPKARRRIEAVKLPHVDELKAAEVRKCICCGYTKQSYQMAQYLFNSKPTFSRSTCAQCKNKGRGKRGVKKLRIRNFLMAIKNGASWEKAALRYSVSAPTYNFWRWRDPDFPHIAEELGIKIHNSLTKV